MRPAPEYDALIKGLHLADERSVRVLYAMYYRSLCYFAERLVQNKAEAEDIAVETFLKFLQKKKDFNNLPDIKAFLFTAARNACIDFLRREKTKKRNSGLLMGQPAENEQPGQAEMLTAQLLQTIYAEIENLPDQCKRVFKLYYIEGKTTAVISTELGIRPQTVLNQKSKALRLLQLRFLRENILLTGCMMLAIAGPHSFAS